MKTKSASFKPKPSQFQQCFFTSTFKGKDYGKYQKGTNNLRNMNRSQNSSKTFQKLKKNLKTQGKNSRIRHLINPYLPKKWLKIKPEVSTKNL